MKANQARKKASYILIILAGILLLYFSFRTSNQERDLDSYGQRSGAEGTSLSAPVDIREGEAATHPGAIAPLDRPGFAQKRTGSPPLNPVDPVSVLRHQAEKANDPDYIQELIDEALSAAETNDRAYAVSELGLLESRPAIAEACLVAVEDGEAEVRLEAITALEALEDLSTIENLRQVAREDPSQEVREAAAAAASELTQLAQDPSG